METPQKEPVAMKRPRGVVVVDEVGELASLVRSRSAEARRPWHRRSPSPERTPPPSARESPSPSPPPPELLALFRVKLQSLAEFTTPKSVKFPDAVTSHYFMFRRNHHCLVHAQSTPDPASALLGCRPQLVGHGGSSFSSARHGHQPQ